MIASIIGAGFNIGVWWWLRKRSYVATYASLIILCNSILISIYWLITFQIYETFFTILIIPSFVMLCVIAGLLCNFKGSLSVVAICVVELIFLFSRAQNQNILHDVTVSEFLPGILVFFFLLAIPINFVSQKMQQGEQRIRDTAEALDKLNKQLETAQEILSHYVAPQLARKILEGEVEHIALHQRRKLTLFFSDIKDFTATTDSMEAEDLVGLINEYLDEMVTIASQYGGTIAQISGDGIFVFFGAPESTNDKDHALRCVKMAIDMQYRMQALETHWFNSGIEHPFRIRCGINTGLVTVGGFGSKSRREYTAIGMQVNLAARLEATCEPGQILLSHTTWGLVNEGIPCTEKETITVKGFHRPIRTYQVNLEQEQTKM